jgi:linoleoyl-CoA desaturase
MKGQVKFIPKEKTDFFPTLKKRVEAYFTDNNISRHANATMVIKTIVLLTAYILPFVLMLFMHASLGFVLGMWAIIGFAHAGLGMSVMHDANHSAYSANEKVNKMLGHVLNLLGGSVENWKLQHNILHHTYTNVTHMDDDIEDKLIMRFSPHTELKKVHKGQFIFSFLFYSITTLYWVTWKDFAQYIRYTANGVNRNNKKKNRILLLEIIGNKIFYFSLFLVLPTLMGVPFLWVLSGFLLKHAISGVVLTVTFQLAHTVEGTIHPMPDEKGVIENDWAIHQLQTTVNFSRGNKLISWYVGGLNYQVEHHLFTRICHVHYPAISHIVKATAEEYGVPYLENESLGKALVSHVRLLKRFGAPLIPEMG